MKVFYALFKSQIQINKNWQLAVKIFRGVDIENKQIP